MENEAVPSSYSYPRSLQATSLFARVHPLLLMVPHLPSKQISTLPSHSPSPHKIQLSISARICKTILTNIHTYYGCKRTQKASSAGLTQAHVSLKDAVFTIREPVLCTATLWPNHIQRPFQFGRVEVLRTPCDKDFAPPHILLLLPHPPV